MKFGTGNQAIANSHLCYESELSVKSWRANLCYDTPSWISADQFWKKSVQLVESNVLLLHKTNRAHFVTKKSNCTDTPKLQCFLCFQKCNLRREAVASTDAAEEPRVSVSAAGALPAEYQGLPTDEINEEADRAETSRRVASTPSAVSAILF